MIILDLLDLFAYIFAYILVVPFILLNLAILVVSLFSSSISKLITTIFRIQPPKNEKKRYEILFTAIWVLVGIYALKSFKNINLFSKLFIFLTFRNGAVIFKKLIYGIHDFNLLKKTEKGKALSLVSKAVGFTILLEILFLFALALSYRIITAGVKILFGLESGRFLIYLWIVGAIFGTIFGVFMSHNNKGLLLQNEMALVLLFTGRRVLKIFAKR
ncbi:hypothetical protein [Pyrococcus sp. ST04]|uniref:hypothetical protein n=1 Tax=Pyrococcus sp. ST04 TaxID=1183377 RepID=UPI000A42FE62|nr:hypothetical protein [Pyrococcus sp. ST04]